MCKYPSSLSSCVCNYLSSSQVCSILFHILFHNAGGGHTTKPPERAVRGPTTRVGGWAGRRNGIAGGDGELGVVWRWGMAYAGGDKAAAVGGVLEVGGGVSPRVGGVLEVGGGGEDEARGETGVGVAGEQRLGAAPLGGGAGGGGGEEEVAGRVRV